jgi:hypothetical protein
MNCVGQCSGHGSCMYGFCKCHDGWYGADCSRKKAGMDMEQGAPPPAAACLARTLVPGGRSGLSDQRAGCCRLSQRQRRARFPPDPEPCCLLPAGLEASRPWIKPFAAMPPAALPDPPADASRKRPFIYVYDMPPAYTSRMLQYRLGKNSCSWRVGRHLASACGLWPCMRTGRCWQLKRVPTRC